MPETSQHDWDLNDLERRLCHALDIAKRAVERLASRGYADTAEPGNSIRPEKVISETAVLLVAAFTGGPRPKVRTRIDEVARLLIPYARSERILVGLCLEPALALDYATAHICLSRLGYRDAAFDALLHQALECQASGGRERVPHRALEQDWLMRSWPGGAAGSRNFTSTLASSLARQSVLNRPMDLVGGSRDDIYAFTHALMYVTDFNIRPYRLPRARAVILAEAEAALARCIDEQDYDLGGEVLLAWPLARSSWSAAAAFGFHVAARVEDRAGFLPAPSTRVGRLSQLQGNDRSDYLFATAYHTIYVMGLVCASALQPGRTPPRKLATRGAVPGSAGRLLEILDAGDKNPHWREEFNRLPNQERDALAGFLLNIGLRRAMNRRDFAGVEKLLRVGHPLGLTGTPAASQAAEMLERLAKLPEMLAIQKTA